jgi:hypothetical protein
MPIKGSSFPITYSAYNGSTLAEVSADQANHTLRLFRDGAKVNPTNAPTDLGDGEYSLMLTQAEATADLIKVKGTSSTSGVVIVPASVATYVPTVLTAAEAAVISGNSPVIAGNLISVRRAEDLQGTITGLGDLTGFSDIILTVKANNTGTADDINAMLQIRYSTGLVRVAGQVGTASDGTLTVTDVSAGNVAWTLKATSGVLLQKNKYMYGIKPIIPGRVREVVQGQWDILPEVTNAIS